MDRSTTLFQVEMDDRGRKIIYLLMNGEDEENWDDWLAMPMSK